MKKKLVLSCIFIAVAFAAVNAQTSDLNTGSNLTSVFPWLILLGYIIVTLIMVPKRVSVKQFFSGLLITPFISYFSELILILKNYSKCTNIIIIMKQKICSM